MSAVTADPTISPAPSPTVAGARADTAAARHDDSGRGAWRWRRVITAVLGLAVYTLLARLYVGPAWDNLGHALPGSADAIQTSWFLAWIPHAVANHLNPWITTTTNYPDGINVMWNTSQPLSGLLLTPVTETAGPEAAYVVLVTASIALSAWTGFLVLQRWLALPAAWIGGLLFGFSPYMLAQAAGHANLSNGITVPLVLLLIDSILVRQRGRAVVHGALLGMVVSAQLLLSEEILVLELISATVLVAVLAVSHRREVRARLGYAAKALATTAGMAALLCGWPLVAQLRGAQALSAAQHSADNFVSDALSFVVPTANQQLAPHVAQSLSSHFAGNPTEWNGYFGVPLLLLLGWTVWKLWGRPTVRVSAITVVALAILSMGPHLHLRGHIFPIPLPWIVIEHIPLIGNVLPNRLTLVAYLGAALILGIGVTELWHRGRRGQVTATVALAATVATLAPAGAVASFATNTPVFFSDGTAERLLGGQNVLIAPVGWLNNPAAMLWQADAHVAMTTVGGYVLVPKASASPINAAAEWLRISDETLVAAPTLDAATLSSYRRALHDAQVTTFVLGPSVHAAELESKLDALAGHHPTVVDGVEIWTNLATS